MGQQVGALYARSDSNAYSSVFFWLEADFLYTTKNATEVYYDPVNIGNEAQSTRTYTDGTIAV